MADIDELKKLSPESRIKRLKALEEEKRKEIEEAEQLIKESVGELEREEKIKQEVPIPQMKAVDVGQLFTQEEKQVFATKRYEKFEKVDDSEEPVQKEEKTLEEEVREMQPRLTAEQVEEQKQYGQALAGEQPSRLYDMAREVYDEFKDTGVVDQEKMYALDIATRMKDDAAPGGEYKSTSEQMQEQFGSAKSIIQYLRGK